MKIAIAGYGIEGKANYDYWSQDPSNGITIADENEQIDDVPDNVATILGGDAFSKLDGFDLVIRSAGVAPNKIKTTGKIWSATNEFFEKSPAEIIGITGSKGKGTTASFVASILEAAGRKVWLVGNIGQPGLAILDQIQPDDLVVYELSSFQLWDVEKSPQTAVVLFIEREHMDVHASMEEYIGAKANITHFQSSEDLLIFNADNEYARSIAESSKAQKIGFPEVNTAHIVENTLYYGEHIICSTDAVQLVGTHNLNNAIAAISAVWKYTQDAATIERGLRAFKGLSHRLSFIKEVDSVQYYDDSIATTPGSAIAALRSFDASKVIILGGSSKSSDYTELAQELTKHDVQAILIGDEAATIAAAAKVAGFTHFEIIEDATAEKFTSRAAELAKPGSVVLLSPAAASFGLFKNYSDRGDQFIAAVNAL